MSHHYVITYLLSSSLQVLFIITTFTLGIQLEILKLSFNSRQVSHITNLVILDGNSCRNLHRFEHAYENTGTVTRYSISRWMNILKPFCLVQKQVSTWHNSKCSHPFKQNASSIFLRSVDYSKPCYKTGAPQFQVLTPCSSRVLKPSSIQIVNTQLDSECWHLT